MLFWRPRRAPSRLKLRESRKTNEISNDRAHEQELRAKTRQLTIYFQFNGHDFESYEVLGLPAGSSFETVEKTFRELLKKEAEDSHEFYRKAFEAIRSNNS